MSNRISQDRVEKNISRPDVYKKRAAAIFFNR